mmetsp:Transcript_11217/g.16254  ORF Transcript_11217/g.16254 Transcript_11217/m.16254 type:complete len:89 (-) Transcript_11217:42-308(-)
MILSNRFAHLAFYGDSEILELGMTLLLKCIAVFEHLLGVDKKTRIHLFQTNKDDSDKHEKVQSVSERRSFRLISCCHHVDLFLFCFVL